MALLFSGAFLVLLYTGIESIIVLNRDLKTKQSYILWMLPKSVWEILGAKFISAFLQMLFVFALFTAAGCIGLGISWDIVYYVLISLIVFVASGWIADRKLSV